MTCFSCFAIVLLAFVATTDGARLASLESPAEPPWQDLAKDVVLHLLRLVPQPPLVAWSVGGQPPTLLPIGTRQPPRALTQDAGDVRDIRFLAGGARLLTVAFDRAVVWDVASGRVVHSLQHSADARKILEAEVFPDGLRAATLGQDGTTAVWNTDSGELLLRLVSMGEDGEDVHTELRVLGSDALVTGGSERRGEPAIIWDTDDGRVRHSLQPPRGTIRRIEVSPCGRKLLTADYTEVFVWCTVSGRLEREFRILMGWHAQLALDWGGDVMLGCFHGKLVTYDSASPLPTRRMDLGRGSGGCVRFAVFPSNDRALAVTSSRAMVWNVSSGELLLELDHPDSPIVSGSVSGVAVAANGRLLAACGLRLSQERPLQWAVFWDGDTGAVLHRVEAPMRLGMPRLPSSIAIAPTSSMVELLD